MELYPAIDLRDGGAVRLTQGDFERQHDYGDPVALARRFVAGGARWLHVVDLDAARLGRPVNRSTVLSIAAAVDVPVQSGGGVRSEADVDELLTGGVSRIVLGTVALDDPDRVHTLADRYPGRVAVGVDYRRHPDGRTEVAVRGWEQGTGRSVTEVLEGLADADLAAVIVTAIDRDGTLAGPDLEGLRTVLGSTAIPVIASGGVGAVADIVALCALEVAPASDSGHRSDLNGTATRRLAGAITGKALVDGTMTVEEGVEACAISG
jgi:phosphoribosylformimino-5-aminoimidazole carboxamide ribotide isomerase